jgi:hypothetical protein
MRALPIALAGVVAYGAPAGAQIPWTVLSPWTMNRGGYYLQGSLSYLSTDEYYDAIGETSPIGADFQELTTDLHLEYGIRDRIGFAATLPVRSLAFDDSSPFPDATNAGFSDLTTSVKYRVLDGPLTVSAQGEVKFPTGYNTTFSAVPLGDGAFAYGARALAGYRFSTLPAWVQVAGGYRARSKELANQVLLNADAGMWIVPRFLLAAHYEYEDHSGDGNSNDVFQLGLDGRYRLSPRVDVYAGGFQTLGGENEASGTRLFLGVAYKGNRLPKNAGLLSSTMSDVPPAPPASRAVAPPPTMTEPVPAPAVPATPETPATPTPETPQTPNR